MRQLKIGNKITTRSGVTEMFFNDMKKYKVLAPDEELAIAIKAAEGDKEARDKLVLHNLKFVVSVAKQFPSSHYEIDDLIAAGYCGLIRASESFDPSRGFKFISFAVWWVRQSILEYSNNNRDTIRMPSNAIQMHSKILKYIDDYISEHEIEPSMSDIAEHFGIDEHVAFKQSQMRTVIVKDRSHQGTSSDYDDTFIDMVSDVDSEDNLMKDLRNDDVKVMVRTMLRSLTAKDAKLVELVFDLDGEFDGRYDLKRAAKYFDLTDERIRQKLERIKKMLRKKMADKAWLRNALGT